MLLHLSHPASQGDEPIATCSIVPSQYLLLNSVQTQTALGHQTLDLKPSGDSLVWIMHKAEEISTSWKKKKRDEVCQTGTSYLLSANEVVLTAEQKNSYSFFHCLRLEGLCFKLEYILKSEWGLASVFVVTLDHLLLSPLATGFFEGLIICDPSFDSSGRFVTWMLVNPLLYWHLKRLHVFLDIWSNLSHLPVPQFPQLSCIKHLSHFFS